MKRASLWVMILVLAGPPILAQGQTCPNPQKIGPEVRITNAAGGSSRPSLVWTNSEFGLSWQDNRDGNYEIYFARISADGTKLGSDARITTGTSPSLVWAGSEYGVSWDGIYFVRISAAGEQIGSELYVSDDCFFCERVDYPSLVWSGSE